MKFLMLSFLLLSTSCSAQDAAIVTEPAIPAPTIQNGDVEDILYTCTYKYDSKYNVQFLGRNKVDYHPESMPELLVYRIKDTKGVNWSINEYDWANYTCTIAIIPKV